MKEKEIVELLKWLSDDSELVIADGNYYYKTDDDGERPLSEKEVYNLFLDSDGDLHKCKYCNYNVRSRNDELCHLNPNVKDQILSKFYFSNEHGNTITILSIVDDWCMVSEEGKKQPYILPKEFISAIYKDNTTTLKP